MASRTVVWTQTAIKQRRAIFEYWTLRNGSTQFAEQLLHAIRNRTEIILAQPESGKTTEYTETREAAMGNFSIYYKFSDQKIVVTAFWDNRQDPKKLLKLLRK